MKHTVLPAKTVFTGNKSMVLAITVVDFIIQIMI